jgi:hypothetical protein
MTAAVTQYDAVRLRAATSPAFAALTRCIGRDRRFRWRMPAGGYLLARGESADAIDMDYPVGAATPGSGSVPGTSIAERLTARPVTDGVLYYALQGVGPLGVAADAATPTRVAVTLVAGVAQLPAPAGPVSVTVSPAAGGAIAVAVAVNNIAAAVPAAAVAAYTDGGSGLGVDWENPLGVEVPVGGGFGTYAFVRDPELPHGTVVEVGVRTKSAAGAWSRNDETYAVTLDSQGPATMVGLMVEGVL